MSVLDLIGRTLRIVCLWAAIVTATQADEIVLVAGGGKGPDGGPAVGAAMGQPFGCAIDAAGNLFIADYSDHRVRKVDPSGVITTVGGTGEKGFGGDGGPAAQGQFSAMHDLVLDREGNIYLADSDNRRVRKIDAKSGMLSTIAGNGEKGVRGDGGPGTAASLDGVASLFFDPTYAKLYLSGFSGVVRVLDMKTGVIDTIKGLPGGRSIAVDTKGNIYVAGGSTLRVRRPDGTVEVLVDKKKSQPGEVTIGDNTKHLGLDADENVLIADDFGHAIKKYVVAEKKMVLVAGTGKQGSAGVGGQPRAAQLAGPHGVYFHSSTKTIYICDSRNKRVLKIVPKEPSGIDALKKEPDAAPADGKSASLFNGQDLTGWHVDVPQLDNTPDAHQATFVVRDGLLVSLGQPAGHLITDAKYENYRLEVEYRFAAKPGNCGVLVHASTPRALYKMFPKSVEVQMNSGHAGDFWCIGEDITVPDMVTRRGPQENWGITEGKGRRILNLTDDSEKKPGEWNTMVIECVQDAVKVWVNGDLVNHGTQCTASKGQIALQAEGSEVEFRRLELGTITKLAE